MLNWINNILIMELVTIIIPYFKKKKFINQAISSVLNQTYKNIEIIIVYDDENKTDLEYLKKLYEKNEKITILNNKKNIGAGYSRNYGIENSKGKYICFLDSDDIWKKNKIENQIKFMQENNYQCSHTDYEIIDENNNIVGIRKAKNFQNYNQLIKSCDIGLSTAIIDKKIYSATCKFPKLKTKEDFVFWLEILKQGHEIAGLNENLTSWRKVENSLSSSTIQKIIDGFRVYYYYMEFNVIKSIYYLFILGLNYMKKKNNDY